MILHTEKKKNPKDTVLPLGAGQLDITQTLAHFHVYQYSVMVQFSSPAKFMIQSDGCMSVAHNDMLLKKRDINIGPD